MTAPIAKKGLGIRVLGFEGRGKGTGTKSAFIDGRKLRAGRRMATISGGGRFYNPTDGLAHAIRDALDKTKQPGVVKRLSAEEIAKLYPGIPVTKK